MRISKGLFWFFIVATVIAALAISRLLLPLLVVLRRYEADVFGLAFVAPREEEGKKGDMKGKGKATEQVHDSASQPTTSTSTSTTAPSTSSTTLPTPISPPTLNAYTGLFLFLIGSVAGKIFHISTLLVLFLAVASGLWVFDFIGPFSMGVPKSSVGVPSLSFPIWGVVSKEDAERKKLKKKEFWAAWAELKVEVVQTARIKLAVIRKRCTEELGPAGSGVGVGGSGVGVVGSGVDVAGSGVGVVRETAVNDEAQWFDATGA